MSFSAKIVLILVTINAIQTRPTIDLDASIVNGIFSIYFQDMPGIKNVTFKIDYYTDGQSIYKTEVNISTPIDGYWIDGTNIEFSYLIFKFEVVEANVTVRTDNNEITHYYTGCWNEIRTSDCDVVELLTNNGLAYYCKKDNLFEDEFNTLNLRNWKLNMYHTLYSANEEFAVYNNSEQNIYIKDNQLHIRPTIVEGDLRQGALHFNNSCTSYETNECDLRIDLKYKVLPPVSSALLSSQVGYKLENACVNVRAKIPKGDWLFPHILLRSCHFNYCLNIRIALVLGNEELVDKTNNDASGRVVFAGIDVTIGNEHPKSIKSYINPKKQHFGDSFHNYKVCVDKSDITFSVDNELFNEIKIIDLQYMQQKAYEYITQNPQFYIFLGVSAGGHTNFKNITAKPWTDYSPNAALKFYNDKKWQRTWNGHEMLIVDFVHVYKLLPKLHENYYE